MDYKRNIDKQKKNKQLKEDFRESMESVGGSVKSIFSSLSSRTSNLVAEIKMDVEENKTTLLEKNIYKELIDKIDAEFIRLNTEEEATLIINHEKINEYIRDIFQKKQPQYMQEDCFISIMYKALLIYYGSQTDLTVVPECETDEFEISLKK